SRFRSAVKVFRRRKCLGERVSCLELQVVRHAALDVSNEAVVVAGPRVLVRANCGKPRVRPLSKEEETGMSRIRVDAGEVGIALAELAEPEHADVVELDGCLGAQFAAERQIHMPGLGIAKLVRNRANSPEIRWQRRD